MSSRHLNTFWWFCISSMMLQILFFKYSIKSRFRSYVNALSASADTICKGGKSVKVIAERLGDTVDIVLHTYAHVLPDMQREAAEKLNDIFYNQY